MVAALVTFGLVQRARRRVRLALTAALTLVAAPVPGRADGQVDIYEYRVEGTRSLSRTEVETAVYAFLGPARTIEDVEKARTALEQAYAAKGYQTVAVEIPPQEVKEGVVVLKVTEGEVGRLRVRGSRYFSLNQIRAEAPSLAEGTVPNFKDVSRDIVALNQLPDRRVTPALRPGAVPGTIDVDLTVEDQFPLHGSLELNNRYSQDTTRLRLNGALRYDNLWQLGHSLSLAYQMAPERLDDAQVFSASYLARFPRTPWLSILLYGVKNQSDVATLGSINVAGRGETVGLRGLFVLPSTAEGFFHQLSAGLDYKHFGELVRLDGTPDISKPITYYPATATYTASWSEPAAETQAELGLTFNLRGLGSSDAEFNLKRTGAKGDFFALRGDLSRRQDVFETAELFARVQGQVSSRPLVSSEEFSAGGQDTVRGYLESEALGDSGVLGTVELRSPSLTTLGDGDWSGGVIDEWRLYAFTDAATLKVVDPDAEQSDVFNLASVGVGGRIRLLDYVNGSLDLGLPLISQTATRAREPRLQFRLWGEF